MLPPGVRAKLSKGLLTFFRKLTPEEQTIAQKTIQRNSFYAHPECILKSMLTEDDQSLRERAFSKILEMRAESGLKVEEEKEEVEEEEAEEEGERGRDDGLGGS